MEAQIGNLNGHTNALVSGDAELPESARGGKKENGYLKF